MTEYMGPDERAITGFTVPQRDRLLELSWAAGFFDGEGSTFISRHKNKGGTTGRIYLINSPCLSISQVDRRPLDRFARAIGGRTPTGPYKPRSAKSQPYYRWDAVGRPSVHAIVVQLWPYLGEPKREQIERVWVELEVLKTAKSPSLPPLPERAA